MAAGLEKPGAELYCPTCEQTFAHGERCSTDNTRLVRIVGARDQLIGRELDGRYTIVEQLGAGGMGAVYRGTQHQLGREVAIKVVTPSLVKEPLVIKRFLREAKLASRLSHPNAVGVLDFGQTEDGLFFLVMELVNGRTLEDLVARDGKLTPARVVRIGVQICEALEGAHSLQIVHRDLKPQNVMVMSTGRDLVKVLDFGLAKSLSPELGKTTMTNAGALLGTPAFMPPELVLGHECDARADLYSFGCILYVCASGRLPFASSSVHEVIAMHASEPVARIEGLPPRLWAVIDKLLEKNPDDRFQTAADAREALENALTDRPDDEDADSTLVASSPTVLGWDGSSGARTARGKGGARIATPIGVPRVGVGASSIRADEVDLIASSTTLPSDAIAAALAERAAPIASAPVPAASGKAIGWKSIALVLAAAIVAAAIAFVIVEGLGSSDASATTSTPAKVEAPPSPAKVEAPPPPTKIEAPPVEAPPPPAKIEAPLSPPIEVPPAAKVEPPAPSTPSAPPKKAGAKKLAKPKPKSVAKKPVEKKPVEAKPTETLPPRRPVKTNPGVM